MKGSCLVKVLSVGAAAGLLAIGLADGQRTLKAQTVSIGSVSAVSYSGQATVVDIRDISQPFPGPIVICDTGPLPSSGGFLEASVASTNIADGALTLELARATTSGDGPEARSETSVHNFYVLVHTDVGFTSIRANFIGASATASCRPNGQVDVQGETLIEGLVVNGEAIKVVKRANQVVNFPGGRMILNEQISSVSGNYGEITVVPIHILVEGCMNGMIGRVHADIRCEGFPPPPTDCGKLTGGGWIVGTPSGAKGNFGVSGGIRRGAFWGHLNYLDHGTGMHVRSTSVTGFSVDPMDADCRIITYNVLIDDASGTARVRACDKGEPGRNDIFEITLSNGYSAGGDLGGNDPGGGNIQLHKCPPGWQ
ncbi:MAG: choice-of-anchor P family protein [Verrucomicrobiota bacterium]